MNELKKEFPELNDFVTLSPIPGFRKWLESHIIQNIKQSKCLRYIIYCNSIICFNPVGDCRISEAELVQLQSVTARNRDENYLQMLKVITCTSLSSFSVMFSFDIQALTLYCFTESLSRQLMG